MSKPSLSRRIDDRLQRMLARRASRVATGEPYITGVRLGDDPPVFAMTHYSFRGTLADGGSFWKRWKDLPALIILLSSSEIKSVRQLDPWAKLLVEHRRNYPLHRVAYAANEAVDLPLMREAGIESIWCNHNAFVDERVFKPLPGACAGDTREFDALYDARFARFKRHHLAARVRSLALVHFAMPALCEPLWWMSIRWRLRHAKILNRQRRGYWPIPLTAIEVTQANSRCRVGLCLSASEGAMVASIQYLLCGLPVVTTPSRGGRDVFFDEENSRVVAPDPEAVAAGVREMMARKTDPWTIRARAIERMNEHRERLFELVEAFQREHGCSAERLLSREWFGRMGNVFSGRLNPSP